MCGLHWEMMCFLVFHDGLCFKDMVLHYSRSGNWWLLTCHISHTTSLHHLLSQQIPCFIEFSRLFEVTASFWYEQQKTFVGLFPCFVALLPKSQLFTHHNHIEAFTQLRSAPLKSRFYVCFGMCVLAPQFLHKCQARHSFLYANCAGSIFLFEAVTNASQKCQFLFCQYLPGRLVVHNVHIGFPHIPKLTYVLCRNVVTWLLQCPSLLFLSPGSACFSEASLVTIRRLY